MIEEAFQRCLSRAPDARAQEIMQQLRNDTGLTVASCAGTVRIVLLPLSADVLTSAMGCLCLGVDPLTPAEVAITTCIEQTNSASF